MPISPGLRRFLDRNHVSFTHHVHPAVYTARELASVEHVPEHRVAKTVVYLGDDGFGLGVLPADYVIDLQEFRAALGLHHVRLGTEEEIAALFGECELGAMPPFGVLYNLPTFLESSLAGEEKICFNAGSHKDVVYLSMEDYKRLAKPMIVHFSRLSTA